MECRVPARVNSGIGAGIQIKRFIEELELEKMNWSQIGIY